MNRISSIILILLLAACHPTAAVCPPPPASNFCKWDAALGRYVVPILDDVFSTTDPQAIADLADAARRICGNPASVKR